MITAGMDHVVTIFAEAMFAAVKGANRFQRLVVLKGFWRLFL
jgi:hypothetical protein